MSNVLSYWKHAAVALVSVAVLLAFWLQYSESSQYTTLSKSISRQKVSIDPDTLSDYVGTYQLRSDFVVEVTVLNGKLFAQGTQQQRVEFHPASESVFFNDITPLLLKFERDDEGIVRRFLALEPGRTRVAVRLEAELHEA